jgi:hypothetical protein
MTRRSMGRSHPSYELKAPASEGMRSLSYIASYINRLECFQQVCRGITLTLMSAKLYGTQFELLGDPVVVNDHAVFVYATEIKSGELRRVSHSHDNFEHGEKGAACRVRR